MDFTRSHPNETNFLKHLALDQKDIWTSPQHLRPKDAKWLVPMSGIATGLLVSDPDSSFGMTGAHAHAYNTASNAGLAAAAGLSGSAYLWGRLTKNERLRETGVLAGEAMVDVLGLQYAVQYSTGRLNPGQSSYRNSFFQGGTSFPSNHAVLTWAFASVVAREYPNSFAQVGAYGLAAGVSLARAAAGKHFLSDVLVGGLIGYEVGRHIYNTRHNVNLDDAVEPTAPDPEHLASTYIPLDSWIYPAMDRLIARGYIETAYRGLRPWTRMNCARMIASLEEEVQGSPALPPDISETMKYLRGEFVDELSAIEGKPVDSIQLSSVYTRVVGIAGQPLNSNNLGQTIVNDYGRPYQQGFNNYTGFTARAEDGSVAFYINGEYQHAPSAPAYPLGTREVLAAVNHDPVQPGVPFPAIDRFRLLDTYVTTRLLGHDISIGKQSLDWGPTQSGSFAISNNAEPFWMLRINRTEPYWVPGVSHLFGPFRFQQALPSARFLLVGADLGQLSAVKRLIAETSLGTEVKILEGTRTPELAFAALDAYICSSETEGFSNVLLEAMASGLPVIATDVGGNREAVADGCSGWLVPSRSPARIAEAAIQLATDPARRREFCRNGRRRAEALFSIDRMVRAHQELYTRLLSQKQQSPWVRLISSARVPHASIRPVSEPAPNSAELLDVGRATIES